jgi:coenzyme F420-reducing hydrogenase alpha subunit
MLTIGDDGKVANGTIIVPTQQNQITMEMTVMQLVEQNLDKEREQIEYEIEKVIRAYDPCMSCASHFLKINWKR